MVFARRTKPASEHGETTVIIVDGYNLLYAIDALRPKSTPKAAAKERQTLIGLLDAYARLSKQKILLVFDGPPVSPHKQTGRIRIHYSGASSADQVIARILRKSSSPGRTLVVSSDRAVRDDCRRVGAKPTGVKQFWKEVLISLKKERLTRKDFPQEKLRGITPGEAEKWAEIFEVEKWTKR